MDMSSPELIAVARDLGIPLGPDGRLIRTPHDPDSRSGHKSGTPKRAERGFIGFETTKVVATCSHTYDPKTGAVILGPAVSPYVLASRLAKANENVGPIGADLVPRVLERATNVEHVLADGGITQKKESFNAKAIEMGLQLHMTYDATHVYGGGDIVNIVVGNKKKKTHTVKVHCGELFHINTPKSCLVLPEGYFTLDEKPPKDKDETDDEREAREERNTQRAKDRADWLADRRRWKYDIHQRLDDGRLQFICPFHAGKLWCNQVPPSPKLRDGAEFVTLPAGTTKCCNGTFIASLEDLVRVGHQEPAYFSPEHAEVYAQRIPVEGRFGTDQEKGAHAPRSCRAARLEPHAIASLIFDAIGNIQITMNKEIEELYELVDNYRTPADTNAADANTSDHTPAEPTDGEAADHAPAGPADGKAGHAQNNLTVPLNAVLGPRYETTISGNLDTNNRAPTPPRAPP